MKALTCAAVRRRLDAFLDDELPVVDRVAVAAHLDWCPACAEMREDAKERRETAERQFDALRKRFGSEPKKA